MIRLVVADDHAILRQGLRTLLEGQEGWSVVGEAADGLTTLALIADLKPDVAVLDLQMPDLGGLEVARRTREQSPETRVVILSMHAGEPFVREALRHGASSYVLKGSASSDLIAGVHAALAGRRYLSPALNDRALDLYASHVSDNDGLDRYDLLTNREREVLQLSVQGMTYAEIGARLSISPRTAESHRINLLRKLGFRDQAELVRFAINRGLLEE